QVDDDDDHSDGNDQAHDQGHVALGGRQDGYLAQARDAEDLLDDHGAAEEADERQRQDGYLAQARDAEDLLDDLGAAEEADERQRQDGQGRAPGVPQDVLEQHAP